MAGCWRNGESGRRGALRRLLGTWLALTALLALPAAHGLEFHHANHEGGWIAAEPASSQLVASETGSSGEPSCPLCLASGQARSGALAPTGSAAAEPPPARPLRASIRSARLPSAADVFVAGPRAPPHA